MENLPELRSFLNAEGKLVALPAKKRKKLPALYFLSTKFEPNRDYAESEVNDILESATTFHDPATLRRELPEWGEPPVVEDPAPLVWRTATRAAAPERPLACDVLVVGASASGVQIADELQRSVSTALESLRAG